MTADGGGLPDNQVIEASLADADCFTAIFERHFDAIYSYAARRLGASLADDVSAAVFIEAFAGRTRFDLSQPDARPWLYGIATNLIRRHHRSEARRLKAYARAAGTTASDALDLDGRVDAAAAAPQLAAALQALAAPDRDALLLFAWADLSYEAIAIATDVPVGTVRSRIHRARARLRTELGDTALAPIAPTDATPRESDAR